MMLSEQEIDLSERLTDLLRPAAFAHSARDIRLVETHISWVILAGDFAYKLRKPVNFGFLDFSTLQQRRADCEAEVALNRRLAPEMYLGIVDVVAREDGHLYVGGHGRAVEPAVQMLRLPEAGMLPALIERGDADDRLMQRIAERLAEFHARAPTGTDIDEYASLAALRANWDENFAQVYPSDLLDSSREQSIRCYVNGFLSDNAALLARRVETGRIRDGHGDLHAASVCLARGRLYLFDCIEFNARYRCADVAAEVAFLAMDLEHLGRADLAFAFVHAYVRSSKDSELESLLPFYKTYRAFVRGKVLALRLAEPGLDASTASETRKQARAYFDLAYAYAQPLQPPLLIVTTGMPASGKTTLANALAGHLGIPHISSDVVRKQMIGVRPTTHRMEAFLTGMYTPAMTRRTYAIMRRHAARYLRRGMSVVLDATYGQPAERAALRRLARRVGADALFIICRADEDVLKQRLTARRADPHTTSDARIDIWPALRAAFVEPAELPTALYAEMSQPLEEVLERVLARAYTPGSAAVGRTLLEDRARTSSTSAPCAGVSQPAANCYGARH